jgi:hypothetical protein
MMLPDGYESTDTRELNSALVNVQKHLKGIILTNDDPEADYKALIERNRLILDKYGLSFEHSMEISEKGMLLVSELCHKKSGQYRRSKAYVPREIGESHLYFIKRTHFEMMLCCPCSNNAIEADLFGPKRMHRELPAPYDKTADYIEHEYYDQNGKKYIKKIDRRKFEEIFLGMTSEEEANANFEVPEYRRFSWSDIKLFMRCQRCFYYAHKYGIRLYGRDDVFGLEKEVDKLLKNEFDYYRSELKKHPIMASLNAIPLKHKYLDLWRTSGIKEGSAWEPKGVQFHNVWENWMVYGVVDDVWRSYDNELIIVDYKSSSNKDLKITENKKQLEFYAWIFKKRNYPVSNKGYFLFYVPVTDKETFGWNLKFEPLLQEVSIDDSWVQPTINNALACLESESVPPIGKHTFKWNVQCEVCNYVNRLFARLKVK